MSNYNFQKIDRTHPIFDSLKYTKDRLLFNYIEGARRFDDNELYTDGELAVICRKHNHSSVWIWTSINASDDVDLLIAIAEKITSFNIDQPEIFIRSEIAERFSDIFALVTKQLDYQPNDTYSLGAYVYKSNTYQDTDAVVEKMTSENQREIIESFYSDLQNEFRWNDEKKKHFINEYSIMEGYVLKINDQPVSVAIIDAGSGKTADIRSLATLKDYRNKGYATALTSFIVKSGNGDIMVYSNKGNKAAAKVWQKVGFVPIGEITLIIV